MRALAVALFALVLVADAAAGAREDFLSLAIGALCLDGMEARARPGVSLTAHAPDAGLAAADPHSGSAFGGVEAIWRDDAGDRVMAEGFNNCGVLMNGDDSARFRADALAAIAAHAPPLTRYAAVDPILDPREAVFCGDREFGAVFAMVFMPEGEPLRFISGIEPHRSCADTMAARRPLAH